MDKQQIGAHVIALAVAFALAIPIGWDREKKERSAGLRTFPLVALASCGFIQACESLLGTHPEGMSKVIEGIITGIGFVGGGAILKHGSSVYGTATAATIALFTFLTLRLLTPFKEEGEVNDGEAKPKKSTDG